MVRQVSLMYRQVIAWGIYTCSTFLRWSLLSVGGRGSLHPVRSSPTDLWALDGVARAPGTERRMSSAYRRCSVLTQPQDPKCRITVPCDACCERCWSPPRTPLPRRPLCTGGCALQLLHYGALYGAASALPMQPARLFAAEQAVNQSKSCSPDAETARLQHRDETNKQRAPWVRLSRSWAAPVLALLLAWGPSPD